MKKKKKSTPQLPDQKKDDVVIGGSSIDAPSGNQKEAGLFHSGLDLESGDNTISSTDEERNSVEKQGGKFCEFIVLSNLCFLFLTELLFLATIHFRLINRRRH